jgi:arabinose-5-phosphate isomerase
MNVETSTPVGSVESGIRTIDAAIEGLSQLRASLQGGSLAVPFERAVSMILQASGRVIVTGVGKSGHVGAKIAATLASTGTPAHAVHPTEASHGDMGMIRREDVVLALSWSGETRELGDVVAYTRRFGVPLVALTGGLESMLARAADVALVLPQAPEACPYNLAPTTSTTMQIALGDALAVALLKGRGFTAADFRDLHPGGKLGERLKTVEQLMLTGTHMPVVGADASMSQAVGEITSKGFGIVGICDAGGMLLGVITDGDIRRFVESRADVAVREAFEETRAAEVMTRNPITVAHDLLAESAVAMMEERRVSALFVVEDGRPVGLVTLLQFLRSGVV